MPKRPLEAEGLALLLETAKMSCEDSDGRPPVVALRTGVAVAQEDQGGQQPASDSGKAVQTMTPSALKWLRDKIFSLPGGLVILAGGIATVMGTWHDYIKPHIVGPRPKVEFTLIDPRAITIKITNSGGQPAQLGLPSFRLFSEGRWAPLLVDDFVDEDHYRRRQHNPIAAPDDDHNSESYQSIRDDFFPSEGPDRRRCRIRVEITSTNPRQVLSDEKPCFD